MAKGKVYLKEADEFVKGLIGKFESDLLANLKKNNPKDDTTNQKAYDLYQQTGHWAWVKDDVVSSQMWKAESKTRNGSGVKFRVSNRASYIAHLVEGFITVDPTWGELFSVERTPDGQFSEQDPNGSFVDRSIVETLEKYGYEITIRGKA